jgi:hypothetical protein
VGSSARSPNRRRRCEGDAVRGRGRVVGRRARGAGAVAGLRCCVAAVVRMLGARVGGDVVKTRGVKAAANVGRWRSRCKKLNYG